ncbi:MAG: hypothetical protein AAFN59_01610 [Pseudomonadota bacterium]
MKRRSFLWRGIMAANTYDGYGLRVALGLQLCAGVLVTVLESLGRTSMILALAALLVNVLFWVLFAGFGAICHRRHLLGEDYFEADAQGETDFQARRLFVYCLWSMPAAALGTALGLVVGLSVQLAMARTLIEAGPLTATPFLLALEQSLSGEAIGQLIVFTVMTSFGLALPAIAICETRPKILVILHVGVINILPIFGVLACVVFGVALVKGGVVYASNVWSFSIPLVRPTLDVIQNGLLLGLSTFILSALYEDHLLNEKTPAQAGVFE